MFWIMLFSMVATAGTPSVTLSWDRTAVSVTVGAPDGEKIAEDAPVSLDINWLDGGQRYEGNGTLFRSPLLFIPPRDQRLFGTLALSLCKSDGSECRADSWEITAHYPRDRRGSLQFSLSTGIADKAVLVSRHFGNNQDAERMLQTAKSIAAENDTLILLDFSAVWCPPCNLLAAEVLEGPNAKEDLDGFEVVVIDADDPTSFMAKDRYKVGGYPTILVIEADGHERARTVGYAGRAQFLSWLDAARTSKPAQTSPESVTPQEAAQIAWRMVRAGQAERATLWLARAAGAPDEVDYRLARYQVHGELADLLWLTENHDNPTDYGFKSKELTGTDPDAEDAVRLAVSRALISAEGGQAAELLDIAAGLTEDSEPLYGAAVAVLRASLSGDPVLDKGYVNWLSRLTASAGDLQGAIKGLTQAQTQWPDEPTFYLTAANLLLSHEQYEAALVQAYAAVEHAWGDNQLRAVGAVAKALVALDRREEARDAINEALAAQQAPDAGQDVRTHRYRQRLLDIIAEPKEVLE
jgi:thiol-disulfide isomerase/thioredoxin